MTIFKKIRRLVRRIIRPALHWPEIERSFVVLGTEYGGWPLLESTKRGALIYSFGIGEDISFDLAAIEKFGCSVLGFDPTPKSRAWIGQQKLPEAFTFHPIGISHEDGQAEFFAPANSKYVSFSINPPASAASSHTVMANVLRLETIVAQFGSPVVEVLKMDIEGFEYGVVQDILSGPLRPKQLLIEFHQGLYGFTDKDTCFAVDKLRAAGYRIFYVSPSGHEYGFVHVCQFTL